MARQEQLRGLSFEAGEDLSADQYTFMKVVANQVLKQDSAGGSCVGVLRTIADAQGKAVTVDGAAGTIVKVRAGAATAVDLKIQSDATGRAIVAASGDHVQGVSLTAAGAADELMEVLLQSEHILA